MRSYIVINIFPFYCWGSSFDNFPIYAATALLFLPLVNNRRKFISIIFFCILSAIVLIMIANSFGGVPSIGSKNGFVLVASRILHDIPELLERKCQDDSEFKLCEKKEEILAWNTLDYQTDLAHLCLMHMLLKD